MLDTNQMRVKPSIIIQCVQSALESIDKDHSEAAAMKLVRKMKQRKVIDSIDEMEAEMQESHVLCSGKLLEAVKRFG